MLIVAILPPDHVQERAFRAQDELFRTYGIASTRALPPLVVVGRADASPFGGAAAPPRSAARARSRLDGIETRWSLPPYRIAPVTLRAGRIVAETTLAEACARLATSLRLLPPESEAGRLGFPAGLLFLGELDHDTVDRIPELPLGPDPLFPNPIRSATIALLEIHVARDAVAWWSSVRWMVRESRPLRTPRNG